jgi:hypothetical protein
MEAGKMENKPLEQPAGDKLYLLRRWGLYWVILAFLVLLQEMFGPNFFFYILAIILAGFALPRTRYPASKILSLLEWVVYLLLFLVVLIGILWASKILGLNSGMALSAASLAIGIVLMIWSEKPLRAESADRASVVNSLIDKIKKI